jgi:phage baseplate assembly protein W
MSTTKHLFGSLLVLLLFSPLESAAKIAVTIKVSGSVDIEQSGSSGLST